ncbi:exonuclease domain-containing protein [Flavobacterium qiangtangense]|uniref:Exonuclease domain-containing protein n=1 Tax=Flavobacterium qiangtangense TaxID=1442595 RepID=A0ABW1PK14_9FLAO
MKKQEYAIVDIETTGGNARNSRMTEIAIIIHDGIHVLNRWESLIDPQQNIPAYITALTGISNETVSGSPIFDDIAKTVFELLENRIFVAHNVNFDYSFVHHELVASGYDWTARKLCTVRASRKIKPGLSSYSLGNLCQSLSINVKNRHRAGGDADATALLFAKLVEWDSDGILQKMVKKTAQDQQLPPNLPPQDFERLPNCAGVYYFHDSTGKTVYVGKAINIKKRVASHFSGNSSSPQRQNFLKDICSISFEECATELIALLLECSEIQKLWPTYNRALKRFEAKFGLYHYEARNGYRYLAVGKLSKFQSCVQEFNREIEAMEVLRLLSKDFEIDTRFCSFGKPIAGDFIRQLFDVALPDMQSHNEKVEQAIQQLNSNNQTFAIIDTGRNPQEKSCIWVENGKFYGMGYISTDTVISDLTEFKEFVSPYKSNHYIMQLISSFVAKYPQKVRIVSALKN